MNIKLFLDAYDDGDKFRERYNEKFVSSELDLRSDYFDNIEGRCLDRQQREIIVKDEINVLVIAGAGSGKTTTIIGKIRYLVEILGVSPSTILAISFTRKSAETLRSRLGVDGVDVKTFHSYAMDVVAATENEKPNIYEDENFKYLISDICDEKVRSDRNYLRSVNSLFISYIKPQKNQFEFEELGELVQYLKDYNIRPYGFSSCRHEKDVHKRAYKRHVVKSMEECQIANCLFANQVEYEYEAPYEYKTASKEYRQWNPDFTIYQGDQRLYLEHFAIRRNGDVPKFFASNDVSYEEARKKYHEKIAWARETSKHNGTVLIETYSYEAFEGSLLDNLEKKLLDAGITLKPMPPDELWRFIKNNADSELDVFFALICTFINLMKSNNLSFEELRKKIKSELEYGESARYDYMIDLIEPLYGNYQERLKRLGLIDFNDLINKAAGYIKNGYFQSECRHAVVDDFQDISIGRYALIKSIQEKISPCKVFAVGDDWQSIYRFTGSDISLFRDFEKYFGYTLRGKIETTYRFKEPLIKISSDFIMKNPFQEKKSLLEYGSGETRLFIRYADGAVFDDSKALVKIFKELADEYANIDEKSIIVLGRYNFDKKRVFGCSSLYYNEKTDEISFSFVESDNNKAEEAKYKSISAKFLTVHKSKGLEADIVIILNCNAGKYGFPSEMSDDSLLNLLLSKSDQFENSEERRLFYVALTRARERVYLIANKDNKSKFILELETGETGTDLKKCPKCKTGSLSIKKEGFSKNGKKYFFYGCSNYRYGCDYTYSEWVGERGHGGVLSGKQ